MSSTNFNFTSSSFMYEWLVLLILATVISCSLTLFPVLLCCLPRTDGASGHHRSRNVHDAVAIANFQSWSAQESSFMIPERAVRDGATAIADWDNAHDGVDVVLGRTLLVKKIIVESQKAESKK
jgi:hypothetical protein